MGILDRVAGAVGVKRRHDGESVSRPLKFANLEDTGTTSGGKVVRQASSNPNCDLPQYKQLDPFLASYNVYSPCRENIGPNQEGFDRYRSFYVKKDINSTSTPTCAKISCDNNRPAIENDPGWNLTSYGASVNSDTKCVVFCDTKKVCNPHFFRTNLTYDGLVGTNKLGDVPICPQPRQSFHILPPLPTQVRSAFVTVDVPKNDCARAANNTQLAANLINRFGACNTTNTSSQAINILPTINPAPSINKATRAVTPTPTPGANPQCALPQTSTDLSNGRWCREYIGTDKNGLKKYRSFSVASSDGAVNRPTCAKISCDNNRPAIEADPGYYSGYYRANRSDTRCKVSCDPVAASNSFGGGPYYPASLYDGLADTQAINTTYARYRSNKAPYPNDFSDMPLDAPIFDVEPEGCANATYFDTAPQLTKQLLGCNSSSSTTPTPSHLAKSTQINILPTINPAIPIKPAHSIEASTVGIAAGLSTVATGILSTTAAYLTPTPTAVIAAAAPSGVITGLAVGLGVVGGGAVVAGAGYGAYRFGSWLCSHPFQNSGGSIESAIAFAKLAEEEAEQDAVSIAGDFETQELVVENLGAELPPPSYEEVIKA